MTVAFLDCARGISGIAALGALIDAGAEEASVAERIAFLAGGRPFLRTSQRTDGVFRTCAVTIDDGRTRVAEGLGELEDLVASADLPDGPRDLILRVYRRLADAEARVHGADARTVRFHELGTLRSIAGVVGAAVALDALGVARVAASAIPFGHGTVETEHGRVPLPAPATLELMRGLPTTAQGEPGELATPTGVALVAEVATSHTVPPMTIGSVGYGSGDGRREGPVCRVVVGRSGSVGDDQDPGDRSPAVAATSKWFAGGESGQTQRGS